MNMILSKKHSVFLFLFFYIFLFLFFNSQLSPLYPFNSWTDVNVYFTIGKGFINNHVIYQDLFDHKGPLIFFIYGLGYLLSNNNFFGVFLIQVVLFSIAIYYIYLTLKLFSSDVLALSFSTVFPLFYLFYSYYGGSAEDYVLVPQIISFYYFIKYFQSDSFNHPSKYMFIHGFMLGSVLFIKLNLISYWIIPLLFIFSILIYKKLYSSFFKNFLFLVLGILFLALPIIFYFLFNNAFDSFWDAYINFNLLYNSQIDLSFIERLLFSYGALKGRDLVFVSFCMFGFLICAGFKYFTKRISIYVLFISFIIQVLIIFSGAYIFPYYLLFLLPFTILFLIGIVFILNKIGSITRLEILPFFMAILCLSIGTFSIKLFGYSIDNVISRHFPETPISKFNDILDKEDSPTLLCVGFDPTLTIFTLQNIVPNVRYFFLPNITIEQYPEICDAQISYIANKEIDFLILDESFRYYDYYISVINENYKIRATSVGYLHKNIHLYEKK